MNNMTIEYKKQVSDEMFDIEVNCNSDNPNVEWSVEIKDLSFLSYIEEVTKVEFVEVISFTPNLFNAFFLHLPFFSVVASDKYLKPRLASRRTPLKFNQIQTATIQKGFPSYMYRNLLIKGLSSYLNRQKRVYESTQLNLQSVNA